jgi:hypothetical protein
LRIASRVPFDRREHSERLAQIVTQLFANTRQVPVVERKPQVVLDNAQALSGTVCRGVKDAKCGKIGEMHCS